MIINLVSSWTSAHHLNVAIDLIIATFGVTEASDMVATGNYGKLQEMNDFGDIQFQTLENDQRERVDYCRNLKQTRIFGHFKRYISQNLSI